MALLKLALLICLALASSLEAINIGGIGGGGAAPKRNVFITMSIGPDVVISLINQQSFPNRESKLTALRNALLAHSLSTQLPIINFLVAQLASFVNYDSLWSTNQIYIRGVSSILLQTIVTRFGSDIASIDDEKTFYISPYIESEEEQVSKLSMRQSNSNTWGLNAINVSNVWGMSGGNRGAGIVIGLIDTGVLGTHQALERNYVGDYGWFDPSGKTAKPNDGNGHGTHTCGTAVGTGGIGVAPEAKWSACKGCAGDTCTEYDLTKCGEFMACPTKTDGTNADCKKAPHIVSNSWGGGRSASFERMINLWKSGGIIPVFAIGNSGENARCSSASSPGDLKDVIGVGSVAFGRDNIYSLSSFSSRGPTTDGRMKPDVAAPGSDVRSAWIPRNNDYRSISGTSMACPHVAGLVALMLSAKRGMTYDEVTRHILNGCTTNLSTPPRPCPRGTSTNPYRYPNNEYGKGLVNALNTVRLVLGR